MKGKVGYGDTVFVEETAPVVKILTSDHVRPVRVVGRHGAGKNTRLLRMLKVAKDKLATAYHSREPYVGCLFRDDDSIALFSVDQLDSSVGLKWEPSEMLRGAIPKLVLEKPTPDSKIPEHVQSIIDDLPEMDRVVRVQGANAPQRGAELIRRMRALRGMSRTELARRLGVAPPRIVELEQGKGPQGPTLSMLAKVADACEVDLNISIELRNQSEN